MNTTNQFNEFKWVLSETNGEIEYHLIWGPKKRVLAIITSTPRLYYSNWTNGEDFQIQIGLAKIFLLTKNKELLGLKDEETS